MVYIHIVGWCTVPRTSSRESRFEITVLQSWFEFASCSLNHPNVTFHLLSYNGIIYTYMIYLVNYTQNSDTLTKINWNSSWSTRVESNRICFICVCLYVCMFALVIKFSLIFVLQNQENDFIRGLGWRQDTINCRSPTAVTCTPRWSLKRTICA